MTQSLHRFFCISIICLKKQSISRTYDRDAQLDRISKKVQLRRRYTQRLLKFFRMELVALKVNNCFKGVQVSNLYCTIFPFPVHSEARRFEVSLSPISLLVALLLLLLLITELYIMLKICNFWQGSKLNQIKICEKIELQIYVDIAREHLKIIHNSFLFHIFFRLLI